MKSFRLRLTLIYAAATAVILLAFAIAAWFLVRDEMERSVDLEIRQAAEKMIPRVDSRMNWDRFGDAYSTLIAPNWAHPEALAIYSNKGKLLFSTEEQITDLDHDSLLPKTVPKIPERRRGDPRNDPLDDFELEELENFLRPAPRPGAGPGPEPRSGPNRRPRPREERPIGTPPPHRQSIAPTRLTSLSSDGKNWRVAVASNYEVTVMLGYNRAELDAEMVRVRNLFFLAIPVGLLITAVAGWWVSGRALSPLNRINRTARQVTAAGLDQRIRLSGGETTEFKQLIEVFNDMMDRLQDSFKNAVRFSADASHELRTPLTIMQGELESALQKCEPGSDTEITYLNLMEETHRLKAISKSLLLLARADSGSLKLELEPTDLTAMVVELCEDCEFICREAGLKFDAKVEKGINIPTDPTLLRQAFHNLLNNAVKYNEQKGFVGVNLVQDDENEGEVRLDVVNTGPGVSSEAGDKIFERFFREDAARSREIDGIGLGLNISSEIIRLHGGTLSLEEATNTITRFVVRMPGRQS